MGRMLWLMIRMGKGNDENDDEFEGESSGLEGLEGTESDRYVIDEDQIFESDSEDDDKWERVYDGRFWKAEDDGKIIIRQ